MFAQIRTAYHDVSDKVGADLQERRKQHPESQGLQRVLSAVLAAYIKQASEAGRIWGHMCRWHLICVG